MESVSVIENGCVLKYTKEGRGVGPTCFLNVITSVHTMAVAEGESWELGVKGFSLPLKLHSGAYHIVGVHNPSLKQLLLMFS